MKLIAECGSTKCDWCLLLDDKRIDFSTPGINPLLSTDQEILQLLKKDVLPHIPLFAEGEVFFYGAGIKEQTAQRMKTLISQVFNPTYLEVNTDILAAARALCGVRSGIACILGTGSNSCVYDGSSISRHFFSPGYFFGDEGGGVYLGKLLINDFLRKRMPKELHDLLVQQYALTREDILENTYRQPYPNRYLAGFVPFIQQNIDHFYMTALVERSFSTFFEEQISSLTVSPEEEIHFTGSVAWIFRDILIKIAGEFKYKVGNILKSPLEGLIAFHQNS